MTEFQYLIAGLINSFINFPAMTNSKNQDNNFFVLYFTQHSVISNPIAPEAGMISF